LATSAHPAAPHHLPGFITEPGQTDVLFAIMVVVVIGAIVLLGVFYFRLHALPEHMAHKGQKFQYDLVAVLALISLFTHNHIFWIAGLLLAFVPIPDFITPLSGMARSLETIATRPRPATRTAPPEAEEVISIGPPTSAPRGPAVKEKERAHA
jgi:hypothetical protein